MSAEGGKQQGNAIGRGGVGGLGGGGIGNEGAAGSVSLQKTSAPCITLSLKLMQTALLLFNNADRQALSNHALPSAVF